MVITARLGKTHRISLHVDNTRAIRAGKGLSTIPAFNAQFQALRYMEFSMEGVQQAAVFSRVGKPCAITLTDLARTAIYKLIVGGIRSGSLATKANKSIAQAASLIASFALD